jgi:hypothetical protein
MQRAYTILPFMARAGLQTSTLTNKRHDSLKEYNNMCFDFLYKLYLSYFALRRNGQWVIKMLIMSSYCSMRKERRVEKTDRSSRFS